MDTDSELLVIRGETQSEVFDRLGIHPRVSAEERQSAGLIAEWSRAYEVSVDRMLKAERENDDISWQDESALQRQLTENRPFREHRVGTSVRYRCAGYRFTLTLRQLGHSWDVTIGRDHRGK